MRSSPTNKQEKVGKLGDLWDHGYGRGGTPFFDAGSEPSARVTLDLTLTKKHVRRFDRRKVANHPIGGVYIVDLKQYESL